MQGRDILLIGEDPSQERFAWQRGLRIVPEIVDQECQRPDITAVVPVWEAPISLVTAPSEALDRRDAAREDQAGAG